MDAGRWGFGTFERPDASGFKQNPLAVDEDGEIRVLRDGSNP
jgi:hypothetical protein